MEIGEDKIVNDFEAMQSVPYQIAGRSKLNI